MPNYSLAYLVDLYMRKPFNGFNYRNFRAVNGDLYSHNIKLASARYTENSHNADAKLNFISVRWLDPYASRVAQNRLTALHATKHPFILLPSFDATRAETEASYTETPDEDNYRRALSYFDRIEAPGTTIHTPAEAAAALFVPGRTKRPLQPVVRSDGLHATHSTHDAVIAAFAADPLSYARFDTMFIRPAQQTKAVPHSILFMTRRIRAALYDPDRDIYYRLVEHFDNFNQIILDMIAKTLPLHKTIPVPFLNPDYDILNHEQNIEHFNNRMLSAKAYLPEAIRANSYPKKVLAAYKRNHNALITYCRKHAMPLPETYNPFSAEEMESIRRLIGL